MSEILSVSILESFNIVSLERVLVVSATLLHSKSPKAVAISLNLSNPLAGVIEIKGQIPYNATAFNAGGDILDYLAELTTEAITYVGGDCGTMVNPYLPPIPNSLTTLEQLFVWSALELQKALLTQVTPDIYKGFCGFNSTRAVADIQFNLPFDYVEYLTNQNLVSAVNQLINTPPSVDPVPNPVNWLGAWDSGTAYVIKDAVQYLGSAYIAKTANTNKPPTTNPTDWDLWVAKGADGAQGVSGQDGADGQDGLSAYQIAVNNGFVGTESQWLASLVGADGADGQDGAQGIPGIGVNWLGAWNSATAYSADDAIEYQGSAYISLTSNTNKPPATNPTDWSLFVAKGADGLDGADGVDGQDGQSIDHISLTNTVGLTKTYTAWGDVAETINLGTFTVTDGTNGQNGVDGQDGATGSVSAASALELLEQASDPSPVSGKVLVYAKTDKKLYQLPDTGTATLIGSGTGGGGASLTDIWLYGGF